MNARTLTIALLGLSFSVSLADNPADFFDVQQGNIPIIISAPHGGNQQPSDIEQPRSGNNPGDVLLNDFRTNLLAERLANQLESAIGAAPYYIINKIDRDYLDLNRDKADNNGTAAFEDPDAEAYYDYYHSQLQAMVTEVITTYGQGILLDIHGQSQDPGVIFRGTRNGEAVTDLIAQSGEIAITGPNSIFGQLETLGYPVEPDNVPLAQDPEVTFIGGYTTETYGSINPGGVDTMQIEIGRDFRDTDEDPDIWQDTADDLAIATHAFYTTFIVPQVFPVPEPAAFVLVLALATLAISWRTRRG